MLVNIKQSATVVRCAHTHLVHVLQLFFLKLWAVNPSRVGLAASAPSLLRDISLKARAVIDVSRNCVD